MPLAPMSYSVGAGQGGKTDLPQNLFSEEEEQEQFTLTYLTPKERERLERDLYDMGLLPQAYFAWAEEDKTAALRQLYNQGGINFYLEKLAADSQRDQLDGNLLNSVVKLLCDFSDTNENYWQKLQQGNILGSILNLMGATLRAPKTLVLNLSSMINSLLTWSEFTWQHDMTYREYLVQSGQKYGVRTLIDDLDKLRQTGALGKIAADTIETVFEMASDPLLLIGMLNQFGVQTPGTQQYIDKLQRGGFVGKTVERLSDSKKGAGEKIKLNNLEDIFDNPKTFGDATPDEWYTYFQNNGFNPQPLGSKSSLKGIPFDQGGGFRISWGGDRYLQYHPSASSHHGGAYWKLSSGLTGALRYDMNGNLLP